MDEQMQQVLRGKHVLFDVALLRCWDRDLPLDQWVDAELALEDEIFSRKYAELRFLMRKALEAQTEARALVQS